VTDDDDDDDDDDDEKHHVLGSLILCKTRCENLKYRFELDGIFSDEIVQEMWL
jgi:hypothetical protein